MGEKRMNRPMNWGKLAGLRRLGDVLERAELAFGGFLVGAFTSVIFLDVFFREIGKPVIWLEDVVRFIFVWAIFIGASIAVRRGTHYCIALFPKRTPRWIREALVVFRLIGELVFIGLLLFYGYEFALIGRERVVMPSGIPMIYQAISLPISAVFMLYYFVESVAEIVGGKEGV